MRIFQDSTFESADHCSAIFKPQFGPHRAANAGFRARGSSWYFLLMHAAELMLGIDVGTTAVKVAAFSLDGEPVAEARHVLEPVERACGTPLPSLTFSGGGARSDLWTQIHADVLQRPIERLRMHDSAVLGAAMLGAVAAGAYPDVETAAAATVAVSRVFIPSPGAERLTPLYEAYRSSHDALRGLHDHLAQWRSENTPPPA
ncbi:FGGY-family carbohydrate kinase [Saccharopolyspora hattusasensis]|uniref:FGGY-family carbohydrate kinase n=1 Tax=Saccharopolyspora hattusasensis TaxID=1128679 RepID=UPI003D9649CE